MSYSVPFQLVHLTATACQTLTQTGGTGCDAGLPKVNVTSGTLQAILTFVFAIIAALCVLMIVVAGLRYVTSGGSPQEVGKAKNTIIYSVAGLLIALAAESLVRLVIGKL